MSLLRCLRALLGAGRPPGTEAHATGGFGGLDGYGDLGYGAPIYERLIDEHYAETLADWRDEVQALADVELREMTS